MEFIMPFLQDKWYILVGAVVVLFLVVKIVKTVIKWAIIAAVLAGLWFYGASYKDQIMEAGSAAVSTAVNEAKDQAMKTIANEMKEAEYKMNPDGTFYVTTKSARIEGKTGSADVKVTFMGQTFNMNADGVIKTLIEQAQKNVTP
jgi:DNA-binding protein YbaB